MDPALGRELLGWLSSLVLLATIVTQVLKQWRTDTSKGVSTWLYAGQLVSGIGFVAYSALVGDAVFVVTNTLLLVANLVGLAIVRRHRRRARRAARLE